MVYNQNNSFRFNNGRKNFDYPKNDDFNSNNTMIKKQKKTMDCQQLYSNYKDNIQCVQRSRPKGPVIVDGALFDVSAPIYGAMQTIATYIGAEASKRAPALITDPLGSNRWTHYNNSSNKKFEKEKIILIKEIIIKIIRIKICKKKMKILTNHKI